MTVNLPERLYDQLARYAQRRRKDLAPIVREALEQYSNEKLGGLRI